MIVQKSYSLKLAAMGPQEGHFSGVALVYGDKDAFGDTIRPGAFTKSITEAGAKFPLLWVHDSREVLGGIRVESDGRSLNVTGGLLLDAIPKAKEVHALLKAGAIRGLSVGFLPLRATPNEGGTEFIEGRLLEISLCPTPAFSSAMVNEVKSITDLAAALDPRRDRAALKALRDSISAMLGQEPEEDRSELLDAFQGFDVSKWRR